MSSTSRRKLLFIQNRPEFLWRHALVGGASPNPVHHRKNAGVVLGSGTLTGLPLQPETKAETKFSLFYGRELPENPGGFGIDRDRNGLGSHDYSIYLLRS